MPMALPEIEPVLPLIVALAFVPLTKMPVVAPEIEVPDSTFTVAV